MQSSDNDILIKIETAYKSGGLDAAKKAISDTEKETKNLSTATAGLERNTANASREFNNAQRAAAAMNAATAASRGSFIGLAQVFESVGGKFAAVAGKLSLVASAAVAGWKTGIAIGEKLWSTFVDGAAKAYNTVSLLVVSMKGLNDSDLSRIRSEIAALSTDTATVASNIDRAAARREKSRGAGTAAKIAEIESSIADPALREKAVAALKEGEAKDIASDQAKDALAKLLPAERAVKGMDARIALLENERADAAASMREASRLDPRNPAFRARRERFARGETVVAGEISALSTQRESAYQTYLDRQNDYQTAAQNVNTTSTSVGTAINTRVAAFDKSAADRSSVISRLQGTIAQEDSFSADSNNIPNGLKIQSGENAAALRRLLSEVQAGNEQLTKDLLELFQSTADSQVLLRAAMERAKSTLTNIPL